MKMLREENKVEMYSFSWNFLSDNVSKVDVCSKKTNSALENFF